MAKKDVWTATGRRKRSVAQVRMTAGKGKITVDSYKETTAKILEMAKDVGMSENEIEKLKKDFKDTRKIKYKGPNK